MPRPARSNFHIPGSVVHVIVRIVDGRFIFDDEARSEYLRRLERALRRTDWRLLSYAIMSNHVHLVFIHGTDELRVWAKPLHVGFAQWINRRLRTVHPKTLGHVIADRPTSIPYATESAGVLIAYNHVNPCRAIGGPRDPAESHWTSHRAYVGLDEAPAMLRIEDGLRLCGFNPSTEGRRGFHEFVCSRIGQGLEMTPLEIPDLGDGKEGSQARSAEVCTDASPEAVVDAAARALGVPVSAIRGRSRHRQVVAARRVALVTWCRVGGCTTDMARYLKISDSGACQLLKKLGQPTLVGDLVDQLVVDLYPPGISKAS